MNRKLIIRIFIFSFFLLLITLNSYAQQHQLKNFKSGCIEGDCANGKGVYASFEKWFDDGIFKTTPAVMVSYFSGQFENGRYKKGRLYRQSVKVDAKYKITNGLQREYTFTPKDKIKSFSAYHPDDFIYAGEMNAKNQYHGGGKLFRNNIYYEGVFNNGNLVMGSAYSYTPGDTIIKKSGYFRENFNFLYGTQEYASGVQRTGLFDGKPIGNIVVFDYMKGKEWDEEREMEKDNRDLKLVQQQFLVKNEKPEYKSITVSIKKDVFLLSDVAEKLLYTGETKNGVPHGGGLLINPDFLETGIQFFYRGNFKNGQPYGTGYIYQVAKNKVRTDGTMVFGEKHELAYMSVSYRNIINDKYPTSFSGFISGGKYNGKATLTFFKPYRMTGVIETQTGYMLDGNFHGLVTIASPLGNGSVTFDNGTITKSNIMPSARMLKTGSVVMYKGRKAAVTFRPANLQSGIMLSNGDVIPEGSFDFTLLNENPEQFMSGCTLCGGKGRIYNTKKSGNYTSYTTSTAYTGSTVTGDYVKTTTTYYPEYITVDKKCEVCNGLGKRFANK